MAGTKVISMIRIRKKFLIIQFFLPRQLVSLAKFMVKVGPREARAHYILEWREYVISLIYNFFLIFYADHINFTNYMCKCVLVLN